MNHKAIMMGVLLIGSVQNAHAMHQHQYQMPGQRVQSQPISIRYANVRPISMETPPNHHVHPIIQESHQYSASSSQSTVQPNEYSFVMTKMNEILTHFAVIIGEKITKLDSKIDELERKVEGIDATQRASQGFISNLAGYAELIRVQNNCIKQGEQIINVDSIPELKNIFSEVYAFKQNASTRFRDNSNEFCLESFALAAKLEKAYTEYLESKKRDENKK